MAVEEPLTAFFGRQAEIDSVAALLDRGSGSGRRLVTLTGAPGIGKTRLALRAARASGRETFACDLSSAADAGDVRRAVAAGLGLEANRAEDPGVIAARLGAIGRACVLLDHCHRVAPHVARLIQEWAAPGEVVYLATSRGLLQMEGEQAYDVPPLGTDAACELFADRARLSRHDYDARADGAVIEGIARKLDGIPLAIELAAARMAVMSATTLLGRLGDAFAVLDRSDREQTLRGALEAMIAMLGTEDRAALGRLAVFRGSFTVESAGAVIDRSTAADRIQTLIERSLVRTVGSGRFTVYEIVRQLALSHLGDEERSAVTSAHEELVVLRASRFVMPGPGRLGRELLSVLAAEATDLEAVHDRLAAETPPRPAALLPVAIAWHSVLYARGDNGRAHEVLEKVGGDGADPSAMSLVLTFRVMHQRSRTTPLDATRARAECHRARQLARAAGDAMAEALSVCALGYVAVQCGDDAAIARLLPEAIAMQHACGDAEGEMRTHRLMGTILVNQGQTDDAMRHFESARDLAERVDPASVAVYAGMIGCVHLGAGRAERAEACLREAVDRIGIDQHLEGAHFAAYLALALQELGRFEEADGLYRKAADASRRQGDTRQLPITLHYWGTLAHETDDLETAIARYREAAALYAGGTREIATCTHAALAGALAATGRSSEAKAELASAMHACRELGPVWKAVARVHAAHVGVMQGESAKAARPDLTDAETNEDVRFALRLLRNRAEHPPCDLVIGPRATWFQIRSGRRVALERREVLRRLLTILVDRASVTSDDLIAALWPNERLSRRVGLNRVYVAVSQLRALGLGPWITQEGGRYWLKATHRRAS